MSPTAAITHALAPLADKARPAHSVTANATQASCAAPSPEARQFCTPNAVRALLTGGA